MNITDAAAFGDTIRRRRKEMHYTQAFLAEFSGFSVSFISDLENGKICRRGGMVKTGFGKNTEGCMI